MTKKDFFSVLIKLFGLQSLIITIFSTIPNYTAFSASEYSIEFIITIVISLGVTIGLFSILIFKSNWIVTVLKLDKGFDTDEINIGGLNSEEIIKTGTFIIGGIVFINNISNAISQGINLLYLDTNDFDITINQKLYLGQSIVIVIVGWLLMTNYSRIAKWFNNQYK